MRWARVFATVAGLSSVLAYPVASALADDDDEEEDEDDEEEEEEGDDEEEEQPPVTAGGLYTLETYPQAELLRPLTITQKMTEVRAGISMDISANTAFETFGADIQARHGFADNIEGQFHLAADFEFTKVLIEPAIEMGIVYDVVDFRLAAALTTGDATTVSFPFGFPFRYALQPQVGLIALDTFMTIDTKGKPDLTPSVGVIVQPAPILAIKVKAGINIEDFDTDGKDTDGDGMDDTATFLIPVSLDVQLSPNQKVDLGLQFMFPNLKPFDPDGDGPAEPPKFYDERALLLYGQLRFGAS